MSRLFKLGSTAVTIAVISGMANAHPLPKTASPKPNAVLTASPTEIRIGFSEGLEIAFSGIEVDDASGKAVPAGAASLDASNSTELIVQLKAKLAPGTYIVKWHAVGEDTHHVSGHYIFQVKG
jgi:methionine-rich copper-binding protein CopC